MKTKKCQITRTNVHSVLSQQELASNASSHRLKTLVASNDSGGESTIWPITIICFVAALGVGSAQAEEVAPSRPSLPLSQEITLSKLCPSGSLLELAFGSTVLFVDPRWLYWLERPGGGSVSDCPVGPLKVREVVFRYPRFDEAHQFFLDRGLPPEIRFQDARAVDHGFLPENIPTVPSRRVVVSGRGYVEDISEAFDPKRLLGVDARRYRLQHQWVDGTQRIDPILIVCSGKRDERHPGRVCSARYALNNDIVVVYSFRQDKGARPDWPWKTRTGSVSEPDDLIDLDARVREWVKTLKRPRSLN